MIPGVTGNAQLLCGDLAGLLYVDRDRQPSGELAYRPVAVSANRASIEVEAEPSGNRFRISVEQIGGLE